MDYLPNAAENSAGRVQIATSAQISAQTSLGSTGARLVVPCDKISLLTNYWSRGGGNLSPTNSGDGLIINGNGLFNSGLTVQGQAIFSAGYLAGIFATGPNKYVVNVTNSGSLGFWGATPTTQPTVTGSKGGNAALGSLLFVLNAMGLIIDSTT